MIEAQEPAGADAALSKLRYCRPTAVMISMATAVIPVTFPLDILPFSAAVTGPVRTTPVKRHTISPNSSMSGKNSAIPQGRRERPCDACRKRKSKCVIGEGQRSCAACGVHGQDCTFIEDPQPRKRKTDAEATEPDAPKRRSVHDPVAGETVHVYVLTIGRKQIDCFFLSRDCGRRNRT